MEEWKMLTLYAIFLVICLGALIFLNWPTLTLEVVQETIPAQCLTPNC